MVTKFSDLSAEKTALFLFAIFFICIMLILAVALPNPTQLQWRVFGLVLAMAAAGFGAILPGALKVHINKTIKATGAIGLFVIVYFFNPAVLVSDDPFHLPEAPPVKQARQLADKMVEEINQGHYAEFYDNLHPAFKKAFDKEQFILISKNYRAPYGQANRTTFSGVHAFDSFSPPRGHFLTYTYISEFPDGRKITESPTVFASESDKWHPASYGSMPLAK